MASSSSLEDAVSELMDSPGGQLLNSTRDYLRKRATALVGLPDRQRGCDMVDRRTTAARRRERYCHLSC